MKVQGEDMRKLLLAVCMVCLLCGCTPDTEKQETLPPLKQHTPVDDMRAVWVSYLELDPAFAGADASAARAYIDGVMDTCQRDGLNTVIFHVRAKGDAYYRSAVFPPADSVKALLDSGFDPLEYAVQAAHARGIALHAWVNPYRLGADRTKAVCEDVYEFEGNFYYVPTSAAVQRCILEGVRELVRNYEVDGVQYDDYFYPVGLPQTALGFETPPASLSVVQWRTKAVSGLIAATKSAVHIREGCLFGVSPAGDLTRNKEQLYADVAHWLKYGYVDYLCPQLYSGFENETLPFKTQADAFANLQRAENVRLYAGLPLYKAGTVDSFAGSGAAEWQNGGGILAAQLAYTKEKGYNGVAVFRYAHWTDDGNAVLSAERDTLKAAFSH